MELIFCWKVVLSPVFASNQKGVGREVGQALSAAS
jgi:hypothetical protein